jgi:hypothetical protein
LKFADERVIKLSTFNKSLGSRTRNIRLTANWIKRPRDKTISPKNLFSRAQELDFLINVINLYESLL